MSESQTAVFLGDVLSVGALVGNIAERLVSVRPHPTSGLNILNYTPQAQYKNDWTHELRLCRGLIISGPPDDPKSIIVARPFAKFPNLAEYATGGPFGALPERYSIEVTEKMDGSLAIVYFDGSRYQVATRGSFESPQAASASKLLGALYPDLEVPSGTTLLCEYIAPWNRIVVPYEQESLVALAAIDNATGADVDLSWWTGPRAKVHSQISDLNDLRDKVGREDTASAEGFVVRFIPDTPNAPSMRAKVKYAEYLRLHRMVTGVSTLTIWEHLSQGKDLAELLDAVPDEFYKFVSATVATLKNKFDELMDAASLAASLVAGLPRKDAAAILTKYDRPVSIVAFALLDNKDVAPLIWKMIRPEFKVPGYHGTTLAE